VTTRLACSPVCLSSIKVTKYPDRYHSPYSIPLLNGWARLVI